MIVRSGGATTAKNHSAYPIGVLYPSAITHPKKVTLEIAVSSHPTFLKQVTNLLGEMGPVSIVPIPQLRESCLQEPSARMSTMTNREGPRPAHANELDSILDLANEVMRVGEGSEPTIATDYPFIYNQENIENIMIVKDRDRVVSTAAIWINMVEAGNGRIRAGGINCVATLPDYRGHGLATEVMEAAVEHLAGLGCHVGRLTTNINDWYHRLGWEDAGALLRYRLTHSNIVLFPALPEEMGVTNGTEFSKEIIFAIVSLRKTDELGGGRTPKIMRALLEAGSDPNHTGNTEYVIVWRDGIPVAYCLVTENRVVEWGGPADLVAGLVRAWFGHRVGDRGGQLIPGSREKVAVSPELTLVAPETGHPFADILQSLSLPCRKDYWGMLYIIDPRGILDGFGLQDIAVTEVDGEFALTRGDESVSVSRQKMAKLLFGPERISNFACDVLPLIFWEWPLEHV